MRVLVQRSLESSVFVKEKLVGSIDYGMVLLVGFQDQDDNSDVELLAHKILNLRIFEDEAGKMNRSILEIHGSILSISQFTLYANTKRGNRPSFKEAMAYDQAKVLYELLNEKLKQFVSVQTGIYGENMQVHIQNDGPVTILLESRENDVKR